MTADKENSTGVKRPTNDDLFQSKKLDHSKTSHQLERSLTASHLKEDSKQQLTVRTGGNTNLDFENHEKYNLAQLSLPQVRTESPMRGRRFTGQVA